MNNDFTFVDIETLLMTVSLSEHAEHYGYLENLIQLDYSKEDQARYAIRRWLIPEYQLDHGRTEIGRERVKLALRVALSRWGRVYHGDALPGIDTQQRTPCDQIKAEHQFFMWLWEELFAEPFVPLGRTDDYLERTDLAFTNAIDAPERWGTSRLAPISRYDSWLNSNAWRPAWAP